MRVYAGRVVPLDLGHVSVVERLGNLGATPGEASGAAVRGRLLWFAVCAACDFAALVLAYVVALDVSDGVSAASYVSLGTAFGALFVATLTSFAAFGLYAPEAHVYGPLLLRTLIKAAATALIISVVAVFFIDSPYLRESRLLLLVTFGLFTLFAAVLRVSIVRMHRRRIIELKPTTLVVGQSARSEVLRSRLSDLCGFNRWKSVVCAGGASEYVAAAAHALDEAAADGCPVQTLVIDAGGMPLPAVLPLTEMVRERRCCEVYVLSELTWPLRPNLLLGQLFEAPVVRLRRRAPNGVEHRVKRVLDAGLATVGLIILALPMAVIAMAVKLTSPGQLFYCQERIGLRGRPFRFIKFRSMVAGGDDRRHREYVQALIAGDDEACDRGNAEEHCRVLKMMEDDRVTPVGRFLRRFSLDELPQFWNVLRGDMSLVGPRPPLQYEVEAYSDWHRLRLQALPGVSGLWQVGGRSRVTFDEMVFQDLFYAANQSPLADLAICLRTAPAMINGRGAV